MDFDLKWESTLNGKPMSGTDRLTSESVLDALETFFSDKGNIGKHLTGVVSVYENPFVQKKRKMNHESDY